MHATVRRSLLAAVAAVGVAVLRLLGRGLLAERLTTLAPAPGEYRWVSGPVTLTGTTPL